MGTTSWANWIISLRIHTWGQERVRTHVKLESWWWVYSVRWTRATVSCSTGMKHSGADLWREGQTRGGGTVLRVFKCGSSSSQRLCSFVARGFYKVALFPSQHFYFTLTLVNGRSRGLTWNKCSLCLWSPYNKPMRWKCLARCLHTISPQQTAAILIFNKDSCISSPTGPHSWLCCFLVVSWWMSPDTSNSIQLHFSSKIPHSFCISDHHIPSVQFRSPRMSCTFSYASQPINEHIWWISFHRYFSSPFISFHSRNYHSGPSLIMSHLNYSNHV